MLSIKKITLCTSYEKLQVWNTIWNESSPEWAFVKRNSKGFNGYSLDSFLSTLTSNSLLAHSEFGIFVFSDIQSAVLYVGYKLKFKIMYIMCTINAFLRYDKSLEISRHDHILPTELDVTKRTFLIIPDIHLSLGRYLPKT